MKRPKERMTVAAEGVQFGFDEDTLLARKFLAGDVSAFDVIYRRYHDRVYTIAKGILLNAEDAHDAVQETFTSVYRNLRRFNYRSKLGTWIFRIAVNTAIQRSRRLKGSKKLVELDEAIGIEAPEAEADFEDATRVQTAMQQLSPQDRAIITMFYWDDLSLLDIGEALDCGANAAKTRLHRARERFRVIYESLRGEE